MWAGVTKKVVWMQWSHTSSAGNTLVIDSVVMINNVFAGQEITNWYIGQDT